MAYDKGLADRIRHTLRDAHDVTEKAMFGGVAFMHAGKMFCGIVGRDLMVRVGPDAHDAALAEDHVRPMDFSGRPMKGYVYVAPEGVDEDAALASWVRRGLDHAERLVADPVAPKARRRSASKR